METIILHSTSKERVSLFEQLVKALNVPFEKEESPYAFEFVAKIKKGEKVATKEGKSMKADMGNLCK